MISESSTPRGQGKDAKPRRQNPIFLFFVGIVSVSLFSILKLGRQAIAFSESIDKDIQKPSSTNIEKIHRTRPTTTYDKNNSEINNLIKEREETTTIQNATAVTHTTKNSTTIQNSTTKALNASTIQNTVNASTIQNAAAVTHTAKNSATEREETTKASNASTIQNTTAVKNSTTIQNSTTLSHTAWNVSTTQSTTTSLSTTATTISNETKINTTPTTTQNATTVAYAVSLIKCSGGAANAAGLVDASLVMRHSIHQTSVRNPNSGSKYDYKMYAIVHQNAEECSKPLKRAGFEIILVDYPVQRNEVRGEHLRKKIHNAYGLGLGEFIKLYAFNKISEEIFVHVDIDFAFYKPMDHLFDAILYSKDSEQGRLARSKIERERGTDPWPDQIDAFITRDWHQVAPHKFPPGYQAGFMVGRHNPEVFDDMIEIIKEGNYSNGWGWTSGWGNKGYGGYVGAMTMQGFVAYYYDHIRPNTTVELNQCRYNHMGLDVRYNKDPHFRAKWGKRGQCRNNNPEDICEDCMVTESEKIYNVHYTQCRKPWQCMATGFPGGRRPDGPKASAIDIDAVRLDHCMMLLQKWHSVRLDLEDKLFNLTGDSSIMEGRNGTYNSDVFLGHCTDDGNHGYIRLSGKEESYDRFVELYDS